MSDVFYVVSGEGADDYSAVAFTNSDKDADNKAAAEEFLSERKAAAPWAKHTVMDAGEFEKYTDPKNAPSDPAPAN